MFACTKNRCGGYYRNSESCFILRRDFGTYHAKVIDNFGNTVNTRHYVKEIDNEEVGLLEEGYKLNQKFIFRSNPYEENDIEVNKRIDQNPGKKQYVGRLNDGVILERSRVITNQEKLDTIDNILKDHKYDILKKK